MKRNYLYLWSLLLVSFAIFFVLSTCDDGFSIAGMHVKSSGMAKAVLSSEEAEAVNSDNITVNDIDAPKPENKVVEVDTLPKTILFLGDSMLEGLSKRLAAYCDASGHKLYAVIWYSSTTEIWGNVNLITKYIDQIHPDYIFICLGANELFIKDIVTKRDGYVKHMLSEIGDLPYVWIGPPNWKQDTGINDLIASNVPSGSFFLTNGMKFNRKKDGAHPTTESAIEWMDSVVRWMPLHSSHPILLKQPEKKTALPARTFVHSPGPKP